MQHALCFPSQYIVCSFVWCLYMLCVASVPTTYGTYDDDIHIEIDINIFSEPLYHTFMGIQ